MLTWLFIGTIVQLIIVIERVVRHVTDFHCEKDEIKWFMLGILIGSIINILIWPISIVCEIINIKRGI